MRRNAAQWNAPRTASNIAATLTQAPSRTPSLPAGVVLLAAGRGTRLAELTAHTHKSLLPVAGKPALQHVIDELTARGVADIVIVTGDKRDVVERFVRERYDGRVTVAFNERFAADTNILSTEIGVAALRRPEAGYMIVETDLVAAAEAWATILDVGDGRQSFWVTRGVYGKELTGGALRTDAEGRVTELICALLYTPAYEGWQKLLGILFVGSDQVAADRELRRRGIERTIGQYYMMPWVENLAALPCRARPLGDLYAASFNDLESYRRIGETFAAVLAGAGR